MKAKLYVLCTIFSTLLTNIVIGQTTGLNIYQPDFSTQQAGWTLNGNSSFGTVNSATALILNPSTGSQVGSAFWSQIIHLPSDGSFSAAFTFQIDQNTSRADGLTFMIQQSSLTAKGAVGGGLGYSGIGGISLAVEFDTYQNAGDPDNNHIALDLNGNVSHSTGVVASLDKTVLDLADSKLKYVWIDYNGSTNLFEVRIATSNSRPATASISTTSYNLGTMFSSKSVYVGFSGGTGGSMERHSITSFDFITKYSPITTSTNTYAQDPLKITLTSSTNVLNADGVTVLPITITLLDAGSAPLAFQPVTVSITSGTGALTIISGTTNASGQLVTNLSTTFVGGINVRSIATYGGASATGSFTGVAVLPIVISDFTGKIEGSSVLLNWQISSIDNGKDIVIERSSDGINFDSIGVLEVSGQNGLLGKNSFVDGSPLAGKSFYRLELNNLDAVSSFSNIVSVSFAVGSSSNIKILGNPLTSDLRLSGLNGEKGMVVIYDAMGRIMQSASTEGATGILTISCHNLPNGQYFVKIIQNNDSQSMSFVKI